MTLIDIGTSLPWSGRATQGGVGDTGPYTHLQWQELWGYASPYGAQSNAGIVPGSNTAALTTASSVGPLEITATNPASAAVTINPGTAIVQGIKYTLDTATNQTIAANASGNPRIDAIVLRADYAGQTVRPYYLQGTAAASPVPPTLTRTGAPAGFWDVVLAYIEVANGFATIAQVSIQDARQHISPDRLGFTINSPSGVGTQLYEPGYPLLIDAANLEMTTSALLDNHRMIGVAEHYILSNLGELAGRLITHGLGYVETSEAVAVGEYLEQSATTGQARGTATPENAFGIALSATTGAGQKALAIITPRIPNQPAYVKVSDTKANTLQGGTFTSGAWRTRDITTEDNDTAGIASIAGNQITLEAGTYEYLISAPALSVDSHVARLQNITAGTTLGLGTVEISSSAALYAQTRSWIQGRFTLAAQSVLEVQHRCQTTNATQGFGAASAFGVSEIYTVAEFWRVLT